jgi:hypothetical protein
METLVTMTMSAAPNMLWNHDKYSKHGDHGNIVTIATMVMMQT